MPTVASAQLTVHCFCGKRYALDRTLAGRKIRCGRCKSVLRVSGGGRPAGSEERRPASDSRPARAEAPGHDPYAPPVAKTADRLATSRPDPGFERDLTAEGHVMAIGLWTRVWGVLLGLYSLLLLAAVAAAGLVGLVVFVPAVVMSVAHVWVGSHLMQLRPWSRIGFGVLAGISALGASVNVLTGPGHLKAAGLLGLVWTGAQLWAVFGEAGARVFSAEYLEQRAHDDTRVPFWRSVFFVVPAVCLAALLLLALCVFGLAFVR
ncbi:MAG: hypothetical protein R3F62_25965 [Planctomycetota bacterium]